MNHDLYTFLENINYLVKLIILSILPQLLYTLGMNFGLIGTNSLALHVILGYQLMMSIFLITTRWYCLHYEYKIFSYYLNVRNYLPKMWLEILYLLTVVILCFYNWL